MIIHVGGGDGGLLKNIYAYFSDKHDILFEKLLEASVDSIVVAKSLTEKINIGTTLILQ